MLLSLVPFFMCVSVPFSFFFLFSFFTLPSFPAIVAFWRNGRDGNSVVVVAVVETGLFILTVWGFVGMGKWSGEERGSEKRWGIECGDIFARRVAIPEVFKIVDRDR